MIERYRRRLSGPLLDRIDLHIEVPRVQHKDLADPVDGEASAVIRARVEAARAIQRERLAPFNLHCNARMQARHIRRFCALDDQGQKLLESVTDRLGLSARSYARILKLSRTIADLAGRESIATTHLAEAIQYRGLDRKVGREAFAPQPENPVLLMSLGRDTAISTTRGTDTENSTDLLVTALQTLVCRAIE
jgi:magnesium chelatase family protein